MNTTFSRSMDRRSPAVATDGMVATSQPLAARAGLRTLEDGGNAADAAIATAAVLSVVEPHMTGIGGDVFALAAFEGEVVGLNGSGGAPAAADVETYRERTDATRERDPGIPETGGLPVTVPGALDAWQRLLDRFGTRSLADVLRPAITYAREGFPVSPLAAEEWSRTAHRLEGFDAAVDTFLPGGSAPDPGDRFANPELADALATISREGIGAFYGGPIGRDVVEAVRAHGGTLALSDLESHESEWTEPISTTYGGVEVLEHPPNGQGAIALEALNVAEALGVGASDDAERWHRLVEATKVGFADGDAYLSDPDHVDVPLGRMLAPGYAADRADEIGPSAGTYGACAGGDREGDTVYLAVVDGEGNAVSFINSIYYSFGSAVVARGFALQNRGHAFSLDPDHANALAPGKRPFHTIIPALLREDDEIRAAWGVMGGRMQPQGHVQVATDLIDRGLDPQAALDAPRFRWLDGTRVAIETARVPDEVVSGLRERGHDVVEEEEYRAAGGHWGGGQVVYRGEDGTLIGGSDPRKDGVAIGF